MKVYLLTRGEYSDYRVCGVFSSIEKAEAIRQHFDTDNPLEEFEMDETIPENFKWYRVWISKSGEHNKVETLNPLWKAEDSVWQKQGEFQESFLTCDVMVESEDAAVKTANERRAKFLASGKWPQQYFGPVAKFLNS